MAYLKRDAANLAQVREKRDLIEANKEYWHRFYNDGRCPDKDEYWEMRVEYNQYKDWAN